MRLGDRSGNETSHLATVAVMVRHRLVADYEQNTATPKDEPYQWKCAASNTYGAVHEHPG